MVSRPSATLIWELIHRPSSPDQGLGPRQRPTFPCSPATSPVEQGAEHVEGFAPQVAYVTMAAAKSWEKSCRASDLGGDHRDDVVPSGWQVVAATCESCRTSVPTLWPGRGHAASSVPTEFLWQERAHRLTETRRRGQRRDAAILAHLPETRTEMALPVVGGAEGQSEKFAGALRIYYSIGR